MRELTSVEINEASGGTCSIIIGAVVVGVAAVVIVGGIMIYNYLSAAAAAEGGIVSQPLSGEPDSNVLDMLSRTSQAVRSLNLAS